jgi:23S rRNA pseudouridine2605 synthase
MSSSNDEQQPVPFKPIRLQRFLAQCGLGSRRDCEELITAGRVAIDGEVVTKLGTTVDPAAQTVALDGERLKLERKKYFLLNKPAGFLCTASDPEGRRVVLDLFPNEGPRLFTVGRLDENTTGLLVVTNDGDLAQKLAHPSYRIFRMYKAQVAGQPGPEIFEQLKQGLFFTEGKFRVHGVKPVKKQKDSTWVEILMTEGQNREIRRLFARVGHKIMKLERIGYGPLRLGRLPRGEYRDLTREELAELHAVLQRNQESEAPLEFSSAPPRRSGSRPDGERTGSRPKGGGAGTGNRTAGRRGGLKTGGQRSGPGGSSGRGAGRANEGTARRTAGGQSRSRSTGRRTSENATDRRRSDNHSHAADHRAQGTTGTGRQRTGREAPNRSSGGNRESAGGKSHRAARPAQRGPAKKRPPANRRGRGRR